MQRPHTTPNDAPPRRRSPAPGVAASLAVHLLAGVALLSWRAEQAAEPLYSAEPPFVTVALAEPPKPEAPKAETPAEAADSPPAAPVTPVPTPPRPRIRVRAAPPSPEVPPLPVAPAPAADPVPLLSASDLAGAATAESGGGGDGSGAGAGAGGGAGCNMVRRLQGALRRDADIQAAVSRVQADSSIGRATLVWNGDWVRSPGQEGKGLAGVRQAIMMEVAFAPEACRAQAMRGLVQISMSDAPGSARLVLGAGAWRWTDLLSRRR